MLLSKDAISDVVETLRAVDFYRPAHATVFDVITALYTKGEPADAVSVAAALQKGGQLDRVGGAAYLHTLIATVPTAANAGYYARIVAEKAIRRRLVDAGIRVTQLGYNEATEVDDAVDRAQAEVYTVTEQRTTDDYLPLEVLLNPVLQEIESIAGHDGSLTGVPTGFQDLDALTNGLHPGQLVIVAARPGGRQEHGSPRLRPLRGHQARPDCGHLLAGDEPGRDHDAPAVCRSAGAPAEHAQRADERRRLGQARRPDG